MITASDSELACPMKQKDNESNVKHEKNALRRSCSR